MFSVFSRVFSCCFPAPCSAILLRRAESDLLVTFSQSDEWGRLNLLFIPVFSRVFSSFPCFLSSFPRTL